MAKLFIRIILCIYKYVYNVLLQKSKRMHERHRKLSLSKCILLWNQVLNVVSLCICICTIILNEQRAFIYYVFLLIFLLPFNMEAIFRLSLFLLLCLLPYIFCSILSTNLKRLIFIVEWVKYLNNKTHIKNISSPHHSQFYQRILQVLYNNTATHFTTMLGHL